MGSMIRYTETGYSVFDVQDNVWRSYRYEPLTIKQLWARDKWWIIATASIPFIFVAGLALIAGAA